MGNFFKKKPARKFFQVDWLESTLDNTTKDYTAQIGSHMCKVSVDSINGIADNVAAFLDDEFVGFYESVVEAEENLEKKCRV